MRKEVFWGVAAAPGVSTGRVHLVDRRRLRYPKRRIARNMVDDEIARFRAAIEFSDGQLHSLAERLSQAHLAEVEAQPEVSPNTIRADHLSILEAHRLMLRDPMLVDGTINKITGDKICAEWALRRTVSDIKDIFDEFTDNYFRERRSDIDFVGDRVMRRLIGSGDDLERVLPHNAIIVAHDLSPADTLTLARQKPRGFVTQAGGRTSHTAILARALGIPAVVAAGKIADLATANDIIAINGESGEVVLHPGREVLRRFRSIARAQALVEKELHQVLALPSETACGQPVSFLANVELGEEIAILDKNGAEGVGLLRTEFLFMRGALPRVDEHRRAYIDAINGLKGKPLTIRTFDLGGDKLRDEQAPSHENNPALGLRAVRYCLREEGLFRDQLRGILEASAHGPLRLLFPMITGVGELRKAKAVLAEVQQELRDESVAFDENMPIGIMIEVPSAVFVADILAREVDFFSVGTNDLTQYLLAADRDNEQVAYLYRSLHVSVLRALGRIAQAARIAKIPVGVCGEMAGEPSSVPILLGLGFREFSMNAPAIPRIKRVVRNFRVDECEEIVEDMLHRTTVPELEAVLQVRVRPKVEALLKLHHVAEQALKIVENPAPTPAHLL